MLTFDKAGRRLAAAAAATALVFVSAAPAFAAEESALDKGQTATSNSSFSFLDQELPFAEPGTPLTTQPEYRVDRESPVEDVAGILLVFRDSQSLERLLDDGTYESTNHAYAAAGYDNCIYVPSSKATQCFLPYDVELGKTYTLSGPLTYVIVGALTDDDAGVYTARDIDAGVFEGYAQIHGYDPDNENNLTLVETTPTRGGDYYDDFGLVTWETPRG
ncbi:hypothetical protein AB0B28_00325 [Glycomyces sp. NPDC046736]|uniref:hypothetical protein n=1 Tax=Glycomyces sp. NPDC046736 TaxID=3155615 RepID=UPI0033EF8ACC